MFDFRTLELAVMMPTPYSLHITLLNTLVDMTLTLCISLSWH